MQLEVVTHPNVPMLCSTSQHGVGQKPNGERGEDSVQTACLKMLQFHMIRTHEKESKKNCPTHNDPKQNFCAVISISMIHNVISKTWCHSAFCLMGEKILPVTQNYSK